MFEEPRLSQQAEVPKIKGVVLGKTLGQGSFAFVKLAYLKKKPKQTFAIKFINRQASHERNVNDDDIYRELMLHKTCSGHPNIIQLYDAKSDKNFLWMIMELASSGDLFDKIEPDVGVDEEIAHFYFKQLTGAITFLHSKKVAHRDIKPENILLDRNGDLKIADFGLACVFRNKEEKIKLSTKACGSPPYMAPEVVSPGYRADYSDIWSCGILLYVLLTGETLWEEPTKRDPDFKYYLENTDQVAHTYPWSKLSLEVVALIRSILKVEPKERLSMEKIRLHPWVNKKNHLANSRGLCENPRLMIKQLMKNLKMDLGDSEFNKATQQATQMSQMVANIENGVAVSQPLLEKATLNKVDDHLKMFAASQVETTAYERTMEQKMEKQDNDLLRYQMISKDPAILQYVNESDKLVLFDKSIKEKETDTENNNSKKQKTDKIETVQNFFHDAQRLTRFFSILPIESLLSIILDSLYLMGVAVEINDSQIKTITEKNFNKIHNKKIQEGKSDSFEYISLNINTYDSRRMSLKGKIAVTKISHISLKKIEFVKTKGDPLEWRKFFKRITVLSRDAVFVDQIW